MKVLFVIWLSLTTLPACGSDAVSPLDLAALKIQPEQSQVHLLLHGSGRLVSQCIEYGGGVGEGVSS
jgi:hypothetical protein